MLHIPILRKGVPYRSLDVQRTPHHQTREMFVEISLANVGLIRRDLLDQRANREALASFTTSQLIDICRRAAQHFSNDTLPLGDSEQGPEDYVRQVTATTGLPHVLVRRNMRKIHAAMAESEHVLNGLTRRLNFQVLDDGFGSLDGQAVSFFPRTDSLGVVLPSNSPGVHSLWIPAIALKIPLVLKPGSAEPWTPYRVIQAMIKAGAPPQAFSYYPADHGAASEILRQCGRGMVFGDVSSTKVWANDHRVEVHGPGYSKVIIGEDEIDNWERHIDVIAASIADNSGRSCVNASGVWVPRHGAEIANALAEKLSKIIPRDADDEQAALAPFADGNVAGRISAMIDADMEGATDVSARYRGSERVATHKGCTYLLPTIVSCDADQRLANREFLFPFASVVEAPESAMPDCLGSSLVLTAITNNPKLRQRLLASQHVGRLNFGAIPTNVISWDQPHEGNLFEHLYARRAFQAAS